MGNHTNIPGGSTDDGSMVTVASVSATHSNTRPTITVTITMYAVFTNPSLDMFLNIDDTGIFFSKWRVET